MKRFSICALLVLGLASASQAQISRVFVAVTGNDLNDCLNPSTSCRTLNGAIAKVDAGGEVIVIETGSYAGATITKSVKINVPSGAVAFSALSLTINAGVNDVVVVRGATMKALTVGSGNAIDIVQAGTVLIENCVIDGWAKGINVGVGIRVDIKDTTMRSNTDGVFIAASATNAAVSADQVRSIRNGTAFNIGAGAVTLGRSLLAGNTNGAVVTGGFLIISRSQITGQTNDGFRVGSGAIGGITDSIVAGNFVGLNNASGTLVSMGNNALSGNTTDISGTLTTGNLK